MELILNLVWLATGLAMVAAWLLLPRNEQISRRYQATCLAIAILLLLPVISLSDDLVAAQAAREADCCLRRAHDGHPMSPHTDVTAWAIPALAMHTFHSPLRSEIVLPTEEHVQQRSGDVRLPYNRPPPQV